MTVPFYPHIHTVGEYVINVTYSSPNLLTYSGSYTHLYPSYLFKDNLHSSPLSTFRLYPQRCLSAFSEMNTIPLSLQVNIVRRVGITGFRELGPFIAAGPESCSVALDEIVLHDVDLDEFIFSSRLANEGSAYRPFLLRCLSFGNKTAAYMEGLRLAVHTGPSQRALELIARASKDVIYVHFALGPFLVCCGWYTAGL